MIQKRAIRVVATGARLLVGIVIAVACVLGVIAAVAFPWPGTGGEPAQVAVTPSAGDTNLVCTGDFRAVGRNSLDAAQQLSAGTPDLTVDSNGPREDSALAAPELDGASAPQQFTGSAEQGGVALVAAAESITLRDDDLSGLAASACREPRTESWLVGGAVDTGTSDLIILSNPGDVTATATLTVFGLQQTSSTTLVPAGTQVSVPLASVAAGAQDPIVRVTAAGAPLRAELQSSLIRTLDPSGIDLQDTAGAPSDSLTFAGVQVITQSADSALTVVRLMATSQATEAHVTVRTGGEDVHQLSVPLEASTPAEVSLDALAPGTYSIEVEADAPVIGAVRQMTGPGAGSDFAWMTPAPAIRGEVLVAVPSGAAAEIHLVNPGDTEATVSLAPTTGGAGQEISVPAGGDVVVDADPATTYSLAADEAVHVAVALSGTDALAGWPVWNGQAAQEPIIVYP